MGIPPVTEYHLLAVPPGGAHKERDHSVGNRPGFRTCLKMAMEIVESIIRSGSLRRRPDRSVGDGSAEGISFTKPLRAMSLRASSLPHRVRTKADLALSTIPFESLPGFDRPPNLNHLSPIDLDELYASCDAASTKSSNPASTNELEELTSWPFTVERQEKHRERITETPAPFPSPGYSTGLQPSLPSAVALRPSLLIPIVSVDPNGSPTGAESPMAGVEDVPSTNLVPAVPAAANVVRRKLTGYVGFANLPNQWHRKSVRKGFNFNVMVVGTCASRARSPEWRFVPWVPV